MAKGKKESFNLDLNSKDATKVSRGSMASSRRSGAVDNVYKELSMNAKSYGLANSFDNDKDRSLLKAASKSAGRGYKSKKLTANPKTKELSRGQYFSGIASKYVDDVKKQSPSKKPKK